MNWDIGECKCKDGYKPGSDGQCEKEEMDVAELVISPAEAELEIGGIVTFRVTAYNNDRSVQEIVTSEALTNSVFKRDRRVHRISIQFA